MPDVTAPASTGQRLLWFLQHYRHVTPLNCPLVCRIRGEVTTEDIVAAVGVLTARHEALRTTFGGQGRGLTQVIHARVPVEAGVHVASPGPGTDVEAALAAELAAPIDAAVWPCRVRLWALGAEDHLLCWNQHHLVTDLWSCDVLFDELVAALGHPPPVPTGPTWQFREFAAWQDRYLESDESDRQQEYWRRQLAGLDRLATLLGDPGPVVAGGDATPGSVQTSLEGPATQALEEIGRSCRATRFSVALAVFYALLHESTGGEDLAVGALFANRLRPEARATVGFLTNLLVLRTPLPPAATFEALVRATHRCVVDAFVHQALPYHLVSRRDQPRRPSGVEDVVFNMAAISLGKKSRPPGRDAEVESLVPAVRGRFDLELAVMTAGDGLVIRLYFNRARLTEGRAREVLERYRELAVHFAAGASRRVSPATVGGRP